MSYTLLQIASIVAVDVGLAVPTTVSGATDSTDRSMLEMKQVIDLTGEEIARRIDWAILRKSTTIVGLGSPSAFNLPFEYSRITQGNSVTINGVTIRGGLSADEFLSLPATAGTPRFYLIAGATAGSFYKTIQFWPTLANGSTVPVIYQSSLWCALTTGYSATFVSDTDTPLLPDILMIKGAIARWRRQKGMDYADYQSEYEMALQNYALFDDNARTP